MGKNKLHQLISIIILVVFTYDILENIRFICDYTSHSGIDFRYLWFNVIHLFVISVSVVLCAVYALKTGKDNIQAISLTIFLFAGILFELISGYSFISIYDLLIYSFAIFEKFYLKQNRDSMERFDYSENNTMNSTTNLVEEKGVIEQTTINTEEKDILKTKILESHQRESSLSKKKGKWLSAIVSGITAGAGGTSSDIMAAQRTQNGYNNRNATFETVVTFLVIYTDNTRKTVETVQGDCNYNKYIMYIE